MQTCTTKTPLPEMQQLHKEAVERRCRAFRAFSIIEPEYLRAKAELEKSKELEQTASAELTTAIAIRVSD